MRREFNLISKRAFQHAANLTVIVLPLVFADSALAAKAGHGRVTSAPGQALQISLPLLELNAQDQQVLQVKVAAADLWAQAGLTPPVALESLSVALKPGQTADSRELVISSNQKASRSPVDVLLEVTTATGALKIQSSYLVLLPTDVTSAGQSVSLSSLRVSSGDTLFGIAQRHAVAGADMYQMLLAIYEANPKAFIAGNMNLLRAGVDLMIPDADTIRSIDPARARSTYQKHLAAFNQRRGLASGQTTPLAAGSAAQTGSVTPAAPQSSESAKTDHLRLSATSAADQRADAKVSAAKEIEELQSRIQALQKNVQQLKESISDESSSSSSSVGATGAASNATTTAAAQSVTPKTSDPKQDASAMPAATKDEVSGVTAAINDLSALLAKNILITLTAVIALCALVIAWILRRAGARRDEQTDDHDSGMPLSPAAQSAFDQKLHSISLDLDSDPAPLKKTDPSVHHSS